MKASTLRTAALSMVGLALAGFLVLDWVENRGERITYDVVHLDRQPERRHRFPVTEVGSRHTVSARTPMGASMVELVLRDPRGREVRSVRDALPRERRGFDFTPTRTGTWEVLVRDRTTGPGSRGRRMALSVSEGDESVLSRLTGRVPWR